MLEVVKKGSIEMCAKDNIQEMRGGRFDKRCADPCRCHINTNFCLKFLSRLTYTVLLKSNSHDPPATKS